MSSGSPSTPKSSPSAGPAQVMAPVWASSALWKAVKSLRPTNCVPLLDRFGHLLVGDARQDAREAVAAARDQRHVGAAGRRAVNSGQARGVVAGKTHVNGERRLVDLDLMAQRREPLHTAPERRLVAHRAGGGKNVDVGHEN